LHWKRNDPRQLTTPCSLIAGLERVLLIVGQLTTIPKFAAPFYGDLSVKPSGHIRAIPPRSPRARASARSEANISEHMCHTRRRFRAIAGPQLVRPNDAAVNHNKN
jgi:hypothetical protein